MEEGTSGSENYTLAELHKHLSKHGDAVKDAAFELDDAGAVYSRAIDNRAISVQDLPHLKTTSARDDCDH